MQFTLSRFLRRLKLLFAASIVLVLLCCGLAWWMLTSQITAGENGMVFIPRNTAVVNAIDSVNSKCPMPSPWLVKTLARVMMRLRPLQIQSGWYVFQKGDTQWDVLMALFTGDRRPTVRITIPEGLTKWETTARLARAIDADSAVLLNYADTLEGRLFPNTYEFFWREDEASVIRTLTNEFNKRTKNIPLTDSILTLASIVQAEAGNEAEMPTIACVYVNRLQRKMNLEADPTVQYGLQSRQRVLYNHLASNHRWNTYIHNGLPPSPICSPGLAAIMAAINPDTHNFVYFVARGDGSGNHRFAANYADHVVNVQKYRKARNERATKH